MMDDKAMIRAWWREWMEEVKKGVVETEEGLRSMVDEIRVYGVKFGAGIEEDIEEAKKDVEALHDRKGTELEETKDKIVKEIAIMESKITESLEKLEKTTKDKSEDEEEED